MTLSETEMKELTNEALDLTPSQNMELLRIKNEIETQNKLQIEMNFNKTRKLCEEMEIDYFEE